MNVQGIHYINHVEAANGRLTDSAKIAYLKLIVDIGFILQGSVPPFAELSESHIHNLELMAASSLHRGFESLATLDETTAFARMGVAHDYIDTVQHAARIPQLLISSDERAAEVATNFLDRIDRDLKMRNSEYLLLAMRNRPGMRLGE